MTEQIHIEAIDCHCLRATEVQGVMAYFARTRPEVAKLRRPAMYRALCQDSLRNAGAVLMIAHSPTGPVGHAIAIIDWVGYWKRFLLRRPLLGARILTVRYASLGKRRLPHGARTRTDRADVQSLLTTATETRRWRDSTRAIAKIANVGVADAARGRGVATLLYEQIMKELARKNVHRLDAHIDGGNYPSLRLHARTGWRISAWGSGYFATIDLENARS